MTEVVAVAGGARQDNRYNADLSYEERFRLRQQRRQESKTQLVSYPVINLSSLWEFVSLFVHGQLAVYV